MGQNQGPPLRSDDVARGGVSTVGQLNLELWPLVKEVPCMWTPRATIVLIDGLIGGCTWNTSTFRTTPKRNVPVQATLVQTPCANLAEG